MDAPQSLANQFLIAMPGMQDPNFSRGVTLLCHHDSSGAMGLLVNRVSRFSLGEIMEQMGIQAQAPELARTRVLSGGPVEPERGFVVHAPGGGPWQSSFALSPQLHVATSRDVLEAMARGEGPEQAVVILGYAGWGAGQLEDELLDHAWLSVGADPEIVFEVPLEARWDAAARLIGIDPASLASYGGHA